MSRFVAIDLSAMPAAEIIEELDAEAIIAELRIDVVARAQARGLDYDVENLETDPIIIALEAAAYRETLLRSRINHALRSILLAYAQKTDLEHRAVYYGVSRQVVVAADLPNGIDEVLESDTSLRLRTQLAPEAFSAAGPEGAYQFHTYSVAPDVIVDVAVITPQQGSGKVDVIPLVADGDGTPEPELIDEIRARLLETDIKPLTDIVTVRAPVVVEYAVSATLTIAEGPDEAMVIANALAAANTYIAARRKIGKSIIRNGLIAALQVVGVEEAILISPAANVAVDEDEVAYCTSVSVIQA